MENPLSEHLKIPALLTEPGYCGTLAAARDLGARGIRVWTTSAKGHAPRNPALALGGSWHSCMDNLRQ